MAKICKTCGTENPDNAIFCGECGSSFSQQAEEPVKQSAPAYDAPVYEAPAEEASAKKESGKTMAKVDALLAKVKLDRKKALIILGAVVGTIALLIIILSIAIPGPKAVAKKFMKGIADKDAKAIVNCAPSYLWEDDDEKEDAVDELDEYFDEFEIDKFAYEIKKVSDLTEDEIERIEYALDRIEEDNDDFDANKVTDYKEVKVKITYKLDGDKERQTEIVYLTLIKYKGQWKIYNFDDIL